MQIQHHLIRITLLLGLIVSAASGVASAQDGAASGKHHKIRLTSEKISLPFDKDTFAGGESAKLANSRCLLCHSKDMIDKQPVLSLDAWKKEIDKMRTGYGCPLRADQTDALAEFISQATKTPGSGGE